MRIGKTAALSVLPLLFFALAIGIGRVHAKMMKDPKPGEPFRQEYLPGHAEDMGQIIELDVTVTVPFGTFTGCIKTKEWSVLEAGYENKWYCEGLGVVRTESTGKEVATLVSVTHR